MSKRKRERAKTIVYERKGSCANVREQTRARGGSLIEKVASTSKRERAE